MAEQGRPEFIKPREAGRILNIGESKLYAALKTGSIPSTKIAGMLRVPRRWIEQKVTEAIAASEAEDRVD